MNATEFTFKMKEIDNLVPRAFPLKVSRKKPWERGWEMERHRRAAFEEKVAMKASNNDKKR